MLHNNKYFFNYEYHVFISFVLKFEFHQDSKIALLISKSSISRMFKSVKNNNIMKLNIPLSPFSDTSAKLPM